MKSEEEIRKELENFEQVLEKNKRKISLRLKKIFEGHNLALKWVLEEEE